MRGAIAIITTLILVTACGGSSGDVPSVTLATLVESPEQWQGKRVEVQGTLAVFTDPDETTYGVVEDGQRNRIGLKDIEPWRSLVDRAVTAEGTVEFDDSFGWYLNQPSLTATSP